MRFTRVTLQVGSGVATALASFYGRDLGLPCAETITVGETALHFTPAGGAPFYHFALLVPGDRFAAALRWARERTALLCEPGTERTEFDFPAWNACALYFHDPADNIVELIAHRGVGDTGRSGAFTSDELIGVSEVGLVGHPAGLARQLHDGLGLELWDGAVAPDSRLGFIGSKARTFVLCAEGRGWLPTERPAERHPVEVVLSASGRGTVRLEHLHTVSGR